jgi:hypothetical protein
MSPEQVRRESHHIDGRTDIYSLGVVLYELLCGRRPFEAKSRDDLEEQILHREARPLRQVRDSIPREVERICLKALSKRVNERYTTAKDMVDELSRATERVAEEEGEGTSLDQEARVIRVNLEERSPANKLRRALASLSPRDLWRAEATHRNRESAKQLLQEITRLIEQFELQYDELMDVLSSSGYGESVYGSAPRAGRERLLRTNRKLVAIANEMRSIYSGLTRRFILLPDIRATIDSITAVCSQIAVVENILVIEGVNNSGDLRFDLQKQLEFLDEFHPRSDELSLAWATEGKVLASASADKTIRVWRVRGERASQAVRLEGHTQQITCIAFEPSGHLLASASLDGTLRLWHTTDWRQLNIQSGIFSSKKTPFLAFHHSLPLVATLGIVGKDKPIIWELDMASALRPNTPTSSVHYANAKVLLVGDSGVMSAEAEASTFPSWPLN